MEIIEKINDEVFNILIYPSGDDITLCVNINSIEVFISVLRESKAYIAAIPRDYKNSFLYKTKEEFSTYIIKQIKKILSSDENKLLIIMEDNMYNLLKTWDFID